MESGRDRGRKGMGLFGVPYSRALLTVFDDVLETFNKDAIITVKRR